MEPSGPAGVHGLLRLLWLRRPRTGGFLAGDIGEKENVADQHPEIVAELRRLAEAFLMPRDVVPEKIR